MSGHRGRVLGGRKWLFGNLPLLIFLAVLIAVLASPLYSSTSPTSFTAFGALQNFASLGLLALAVGLSMMVKEFDLSTIGVYTVGGLVAVKFGGDSAFLGVLLALLAGTFVGLFQGSVIAKTGISSVPLTLGGFLTLLGVSYLLANGGTLPYENYSAGLWLDSPIATIFSARSLIVLAVFLIVGLVFAWTRIGPEVRAVGGDRRAASAAGVPAGWVLIGIFTFSGFCSALGGALFAFSTSAAASDLGLSPFIFAITAALLGGVALAGGRGTAAGIFLGVLTLSLLEGLFAQLGTPAYVVDLVRGGLLVAVVLVEAPDLRRQIARIRTQLSKHAGPEF
ncbi:MAG: ABC transporter permease [Thermoleophilia bacterium]|nr:ABC transporter permease [Thermoleophilia bacterium]